MSKPSITTDGMRTSMIDTQGGASQMIYSQNDHAKVKGIINRQIVKSRRTNERLQKMPIIAIQKAIKSKIDLQKHAERRT